jgi:uncharacterized cupredoxin-like copper-binding protein
MPGMAGHGGAHLDFGQPGNPREVDRRVRIVARDDLRFDPPQVTIRKGQTVAFFLTNEGRNRHEFALGDRDFQFEHEKNMQVHTSEASHGSNTLELGPGETGEIVWKFTQSGEVMYGCHEPGHFEGGMYGIVTVGTTSGQLKN